MSLVNNPSDIRLGICGMVEGNGHPYSWSAIINGYDREVMCVCPYPTIPQYLGKQPREAFGIPGTRVTHIWCDDRRDAEQVARASLIPHVVDRPEDLIGRVDAVAITTDIGHEHLERSRPFIEAGVPVFIDKPLTDREDHLRQFIRWLSQDRPILSTSCMRYAREFNVQELLANIGELRLITMTMSKSWERYGIHALEGLYPFLPHGAWLSATNSGRCDADIVHLSHACGVDAIVAVVKDLNGAFGCLSLFGTHGAATARFQDTFYAFKRQLEVFIDYLRTGNPPFPSTQTVELMKMVIAGIRSREEGGRRVLLSEVLP